MITTLKSAADLDDVLAVERRAFSEPWARHHFESELETPMSTTDLLRSTGGQPLAYSITWIAAGELQVIRIAVDPSARRRGLGRTLLLAAIDRALACGCETATLEVRASNEPAVALYRAARFQIAGRRRRYYHDGEDALLMTRVLGRGPQPRIAGSEVPNRFALAPMCSVTNLPFRALCRHHGAGILFTEMLSCRELVQQRQRTLGMLATSPAEEPIAVQLTADPDPAVVARAARIAVERGARHVNLNLGCPVSKVVASGGGCALLRRPDAARWLFGQVRAAVSVPLSAKLRSGWDATSVNAPLVARIAAEEGLDSIVIHARTRAQGYHGPADWDLIRAVVEDCPLPVIGNGDVFSPADAFRMLEHTGCAAVMVGRAAMGNPWIFRGLVRWEAGDRSSAWSPTVSELVETMRRHLLGLVDLVGERQACLTIRKHLLWYTHGIPAQGVIRPRLPGLTDRLAFEAALAAFLRALSEAGADPDTRLPPTGRERAAFASAVGPSREA